MNIDHKILAESFKKLPALPKDMDVEEEVAHIRHVVENDLQQELADYDEAEAEGAGGSGIVISAVYKPFGTRRAVKLPRKRIYDSGQNEPAAAVDPEIHALSKLSHQHITKLYHHRSLSGHGHCTITEYVEAAKPLHEYAFTLCATKECRDDKYILTTKIRTLARIVYEIAGALHYMHSVAKLLHFDVKPDNLLVSADGVPFITDLGFARDVTKYQPAELVPIGFTYKYAHPLIRDPDHGALISRTPARAKNAVLGEQLRPIVDLFAFGRTVQEVLKKLEVEFGASVYSIYEMNYLHVVASLCLDGENAANHHMTPGSFVSDQALGLPTALFKEHKFSSFREVEVALERLLGLRRLEDDVPELDRWSPRTINASDLGLTTLTPRVAAIINHPAFQRLGNELQLGMLDTVFPTATHTRLQHTLGVFHACTEYLTALYYDAENPTFRILFDGRAIAKVLVGALVHDIGQISFGHEMEEVDAKEFSHVQVGRIITESSFFRDERGRTLRDIIEGAHYDNWDVSIDKVFELLQKKISTPFDGVLRDLLDGQLDADKLDYLIRDSKETRIAYGGGIDSSRFLRSLTTIGTLESKRAYLRLAIKRKGAASAEAFALARYQLYQSLYWHHTFRAAKSMLLTAASEVFAGVRKSGASKLFDEHQLRDVYIRYVFGIPAEAKQARRREGPIAALEKMLEGGEPPNIPTKYGRDPTLRFLWQLSSGRARLLIEDLMMRRYYKRVFEVPLGTLKEEALFKLREQLSMENREATETRVAESLGRLLKTAVQTQSQVRESLRVDQAVSSVDAIMRSRHSFIVDLPLRGWSAGGSDPTFVSDYKRRHFRAEVANDQGQEPATLWSTHVGPMMRQVAVFRVFCEPVLHDVLTKVADATGIQDAVHEALPELTR